MPPLLSTDAVYWFSDGTHIGAQSIRAAFQKAWATIVDEHYSINDVRWLAVGADTAACTYRYTWSGLIGGQPRHGAGRGTKVIARRKGAWRIVHEHLSPEPNAQ